jgi:hypothetical protein
MPQIIESIFKIIDIIHNTSSQKKDFEEEKRIKYSDFILYNLLIYFMPDNECVNFQRANTEILKLCKTLWLWNVALSLK